MVANAAHSIGKPYRVRTARRRGGQPQISMGLNGRPNDMPTMCAAMCLAMRRAGAREAAASTRVEVRRKDTPCCIGAFDSEMPYIRRRAFSLK